MIDKTIFLKFPVKINLKVDFVKIVNIFANKLFAVHYEGEQYNEYRRLMEYWGDTELVLDFLEENLADITEGISIYDALDSIQEESELINDKIIEIIEDESKNLDEFFAPLNDNEYQIVELSQRKGKANVKPPKYLRIYAIRIDANMYLVIGGAIKLPLQHKLKDRPHTLQELKKLNSIKNFLRTSYLFDKDSFYEFLNEQ